MSDLHEVEVSPNGILRKGRRNGALVYEADDSSRTGISYDEAGIVTFARPYSVEENIEADARATSSAALAARQAGREAVKAIIVDLQTEKARCQEVIDSSTSSADAKKVARAGKRIADAAIDLARFVKDIE